MSPSPFPDNPDNSNSYGHPSNSGSNSHNHPHFSEEQANQDPTGINLLAQISAQDSLNNLDDTTPADVGERFDRARRSAMTVYAVLIVIGIVIGGVTLVGIAMLMQHFGLTDVPTQVDQR